MLKCCLVLRNVSGITPSSFELCKGLFPKHDSYMILIETYSCCFFLYKDILICGFFSPGETTELYKCGMFSKVYQLTGIGLHWNTMEKHIEHLTVRYLLKNRKLVSISVLLVKTGKKFKNVIFFSKKVISCNNLAVAFRSWN